VATPALAGPRCGLGLALTLTLALAACGGGSGESGASAAPVPPTPPSAPSISVAPVSPQPGQPVTLAASSNDPQHGALSYAWSLGDGATASGPVVTHSYAAQGSYTIRVTVTDADQLTNSAQLPIDVEYPPPAAPTVQVSAAALYPGQLVGLSGSTTDPNNLALSYSWNFGDGGSGSGASVTHAYAQPGSYTVTLTATNSAGHFASGTAQLSVLAPSQTAAADAFTPYCSGPLCGDTDAHTYSGHGVGLWGYINTTAQDAVISIRIAGLSAANSVTLLFSNGQAVSADALPSAGTPAANSSPAAVAAAAPLAAAAAAAADDDPWAAAAITPDRVQTEELAHEQMLEHNHALALSLLQRPLTRQAAAQGLTTAAAAAPPPVGASRTWYDLYGSPATPAVAYTASVIYTCGLASGRNAVFWLDPNVTAAGAVKAGELAALEAAYCGAQGGYARLTGLLGDVWGPAAARHAGYLIQDSATALQDVNIVILQVPADTSWGGYFDAANDYLSSAVPSSNQALAFFINGTNLPGNSAYYTSTLLHESTHMINFYQRTVARGTIHDTWLEETSAMMTEDIVAPAVNAGYSTLPIRIDAYLHSGGGISYITWPSQVSTGSYGMGGSFAAFLDRRYGLAIYQQLVTSCNDGAGGSSYACLDTLIRQNGGNGLADELARAGASVFATLADHDLPWGLGYAATMAGTYQLPGFDLSALASLRPNPASALDAGYTATTQTYQVDTGSGSYERDNVLVPAQTTLLVVVH
jgi:PKD repeat protein